jgi:hypothetical protein
VGGGGGGRDAVVSRWLGPLAHAVEEPGKMVKNCWWVGVGGGGGVRIGLRW